MIAFFFGGGREYLPLVLVVTAAALSQKPTKQRSPGGKREAAYVLSDLFSILAFYFSELCQMGSRFFFLNKVLLSLCNIGFFHFLNLLLLLFSVCITFLFSLFCAFCLNTFRCYEQRQKTKAVFFFFSGYTKLPGFATYTTPVVCLFSFLGVHSSFFFFVCMCNCTWHS